MSLLFFYGIGRTKNPFAVSADEIDSARRWILGKLETSARGFSESGISLPDRMAAAAAVAALAVEIERRAVEMKATIETPHPTTALMLHTFECEMAARMARLRQNIEQTFHSLQT